MTDKAAFGISLVLHPIFMPVATTLLAYTYCTEAILLNERGKIFILLYVMLFSMVFPLISLYFFKKSDIISSYQLKDRKDRPWPLLTAAVYMGSLALLLGVELRLSTLLTGLAAATSLTLLAASIISYFYKISIHTTALSGVLGVCIAIHFSYGLFDLFVPIVGSILLLGLAASARTKLNAHSYQELWAGTLLGSTICGCSLAFLLHLL